MNARLAALADALDRIPRQRLPLSPDESNACREAAAILRALAEQEPFAWLHVGEGNEPGKLSFAVRDPDSPNVVALYTHPKEGAADARDAARWRHVLTVAPEAIAAIAWQTKAACAFADPTEAVDAAIAATEPKP